MYRSGDPGENFSLNINNTGPTDRLKTKTSLICFYSMKLYSIKNFTIMKSEGFLEYPLSVMCSLLREAQRKLIIIIIIVIQANIHL